LEKLEERLKNKLQNGYQNTIIEIYQLLVLLLAKQLHQEEEWAMQVQLFQEEKEMQNLKLHV
jgi:hypothetical protein